MSRHHGGEAALSGGCGRSAPAAVLPQRHPSGWCLRAPGASGERPHGSSLIGLERNGRQPALPRGSWKHKSASRGAGGLGWRRSVGWKAPPGLSGGNATLTWDGANSRRRPCTLARLLGPAIFEAAKLQVTHLFLSTDEQQEHPAAAEKPRTYTLTHSDVTSMLTLAVAHTFNVAQFSGWYSRIQRDEVLAVWRKTKAVGFEVALHVHCHISGGHWLRNQFANLRFWIFRKELPVVLEAFRHGDRALFDKHPDLEESPVWVHFHSNLQEFNRHECWGPLKDAARVGRASGISALEALKCDLQVAVEDMHQLWPLAEGDTPALGPHAVGVSVGLGVADSAEPPLSHALSPGPLQIPPPYLPDGAPNTAQSSRSLV